MSYNSNKSPWGNKPQGNNQHPNMNHSGVVPFQQQQVFQNMGINQQNLGLGLQQMAAANQMSLTSNPIFQQQLSAVSYPSARGLNPTAFQAQSGTQNNTGPGPKQKVFTGSVTQVHENFGFIDDEVFFSRNVCMKGSNPSVGDRVLVESSFNPSMPFKWNATRVQVLQGGHSRDQRHGAGEGNSTFGRRGDMSGRDYGGRDNRVKPNIGERRNRSRDRDDDEIERKRRREDRFREREKDDKDRKSPIRRRSRSPKVRRRARVIPRYMVQIPKIPLHLTQADLLEVKKRYNNLYIPSDFFHTYIRWVDTFPADKPYALNKPCSFHIMYKELDPVVENDAVLEPPDADYKFSAKVMLMSVPGMEEIYQRCCAIAEEKDSRDRESEDRDYVHPTRLINFLVGLRGKNETMAIGGPWSPSLDGPNPEKDPAVLIKTAIRTCKALTGIDLSNCTQWYRFVELYYRRGETTHKGKPVPARVETVVIFLPDVWSCLPTRLEWEELQQNYRKHLEKILRAESEDPDDVDNAADEKEEESSETLEPTHHSELNPKAMTVVQLRTELKARNLDSKGLKSQLVARLAKALKTEAEKEDEEPKEKPVSEHEDNVEKEEVQSEKDKKSEVEEKKLDETQKRRLEKQYTLPDQPHLIVHPSKTAKSGKFDCTSMSLSLLLDYRPEDTKEHSFEVSLFAELFNEMLMRDFGFNIYKALYTVPEKPKEKEEDKKKKEEKKKDKKDDEKKDEKSGDEETKTEESSDSKKEKEEDEKKKDKDCRRDDKRSDSSDDDDEDGRKSNKDKRKRDRVKLVTKDKHLLLSFVYFDQTHCGYIFDKDMEELLYTLGLNLSRSQVKRIVSKVITRDSLHYRKLTDKPKDEEKEEAENGEKPPEKSINWHEKALGNRKLLPVFEYDAGPQVKAAPQDGKSVSDDSLIVYQGAVVDIGKLLNQLDRSEKARIDTEQYLVDLKKENEKLSDKYSKSSSTIKHLNSEVKEYREKLRSTEDALGRSNAHSKLFQTTLMDIRDKIEPVLKTASHKDEKDRKDRDRDSDKRRDRDDGKSRWEKEKDRDGSRKETGDKDKKEDIKKEHEIKKEPKEKDVKTETKKETNDDDGENKDKKDAQVSEDVEMKEEN